MDTRSRAIALFIAVFVGIQVLLPVVQLLTVPAPARFGWQMYSSSTAVPDVLIELRDGSTRAVQPADFLTSVRPDIPIADILTPQLCQSQSVRAVIFAYSERPPERRRCANG